MKIRTQKGFTLVETMVALGIFAVVSAIVFVGNGRFNNTILLTNLAYDLALTVSRAQSYGINVKQSDTSDPFNVGYGVHFKLCGVAGADESDGTSFVLFTDVNQDKKYITSELLERYIIRRGNKISSLSYDSSSLTDGGIVDVTFIRPYPDANFRVSDCSGNLITDPPSVVGIEVSSPDGSIKKNITIGVTGQISVE